MEESRGCHVVVLPWLAFGHLLPFLELSKSLAARGIKVSFISTPKNLQRLPVIPPHLASHIDLVNFPLPFVDGLPENAEATVDLELGDVQYLKKAYDGLEAPFSGFVAATSPDWIIYDSITFWAPRVAMRFGVPSAFFSVYSAAMPSFVGPPWAIAGDRARSKPEDFTVLPKWIDFPSTVIPSL
ncbi:UDP-glycosyltransferase [Nymphaea thermarum]|nr:UDP-glycosyltransferase [Nymphaea thermarum]